MFTYTYWLVHQEHYKDLLREAGKERLAKTALAALSARKAEKSKDNRSTSAKSICCEAALQGGR